MSKMEVQGVVSAGSNDPMVQIRQLDDDDVQVYAISIPIMEARDLAQSIHEAACNAIYEAALIEWSTNRGNVGMGVMLIQSIRNHRRDHWGIPNPEDWRPKAEEQ